MRQTWALRRDLRWPRRILEFTLIGVPLWFVFQSIQRNWQALAGHQFEPELSRLILAVVLLVCAFGFLPFAGRRALVVVGQRIAFQKVYWAHFITQISKYLPGGIWVFPGRAIALQRHNVGYTASSLAMILELCVLNLAGVIVFLPYWLMVGIEDISTPWWWTVMVIVPITVCLHPTVFSYLVNRLLAFLGRPEVNVNLSFAELGAILSADFLFWLITGTGFYFLVASVYPVSVDSWLALTSAFSMAWVIGFLAFLTPAGLGVREGALTLLLTPLLPPPLPALIALLARLWWTVAELICVGIAFFAIQPTFHKQTIDGSQE